MRRVNLVLSPPVRVFNAHPQNPRLGPCDTLSRSLKMADHGLDSPFGGGYIMLSYSWKPAQPKVLAINDALRAKGWKTWIDKADMKPEYLEEMPKAVAGCTAIILFVNQAYIDSANCTKEVKLAIEHNKPCVIGETHHASRWYVVANITLLSMQLTCRMASSRGKCCTHSLASPQGGSLCVSSNMSNPAQAPSPLSLTASISSYECTPAFYKPLPLSMRMPLLHVRIEE